MSFLDEVETSMANYRIIDALRPDQSTAKSINDKEIASKLNLLSSAHPSIESLIEEARSTKDTELTNSLWNPSSLLFYAFTRFLSTLRPSELPFGLDFSNLVHLICQFDQGISEAQREEIARFIMSSHLTLHCADDKCKGKSRRSSEEFLAAPPPGLGRKESLPTFGRSQTLTQSSALQRNVNGSALTSLMQTATDMDNHAFCQALAAQCGDLIRRLDSQLNAANSVSESTPSNPSRLSTSLFDDLKSASLDILRPLLVDFYHSPQFESYVQYVEFTRRPAELNDFNLFRIIGRGSFGSIWAIQRKSTGQVYALKEINKYLVKANRAESLVESERTILSHIQSPFVLSLVHSFHTIDHAYFVFPMLSGGDLRYHLTQRMDQRDTKSPVSSSSLSRIFTVEEIQFYSAQLLLGLNQIHRLGYVYRDLKPDNVLLDEHGNCCIIDLGLVIRWESGKERELQQLGGTPGYWAPEIFSRCATHPVSDYWSLAVMMYQMWTGQLPKCQCERGSLDWCTFSSSSAMEKNARSSEGNPKFDMISGLCLKTPKKSVVTHDSSTCTEQVSSSPTSSSNGNRRSEFDEATGNTSASITTPSATSTNLDFPAELADLLQRMFAVQFEQRLGFHNGLEEFKKHPFYHSVDWTALEHRVLKPPFQPDPDAIHTHSIAEIGEFDLEKLKKQLPLNEEDQLKYRHFTSTMSEKVAVELVKWFDQIEKSGVKSDESDDSPQGNGRSNGNRKSSRKKSRGGSSGFNTGPQADQEHNEESAKSCCTIN